MCAVVTLAATPYFMRIHPLGVDARMVACACPRAR